MDNQRVTPAQPTVAGNTVTLPTELTHIEPTKIDEETQQGAIYRFHSAHTPYAPVRGFYTRVRLPGLEGCDIWSRLRTPEICMLQLIRRPDSHVLCHV